MTKWQNAAGATIMFAMSLGLAWAMVWWFRISWDRALLVQVLWITTVSRWHQPDDKGAVNGSGSV